MKSLSLFLLCTSVGSIFILASNSRATVGQNQPPQIRGEQHREEESMPVSEGMDDRFSDQEKMALRSVAVAIKMATDEAWSKALEPILNRGKEVAIEKQMEESLFGPTSDRFEAESKDESFKINRACEHDQDQEGRKGKGHYLAEGKSSGSIHMETKNLKEFNGRPSRMTISEFRIQSGPRYTFDQCEKPGLTGAVSGTIDAKVNVDWKVMDVGNTIFTGTFSTTELNGELQVANLPNDIGVATVRFQNLRGNFINRFTDLGDSWKEAAKWLTRFMKCGGSVEVVIGDAEPKAFSCEDVLHYALPVADFRDLELLSERKR